MNCSVMLLPTLSPACSSAITSWACGFGPVQDDFQHDFFSWMTDEADGSLVMDSCNLPFLWRVIISDWVHGVGHSPVFRILLQIFHGLPVCLTKFCRYMINSGRFPLFQCSYCDLNFLTEDWLQGDDCSPELYCHQNSYSHIVLSYTLLICWESLVLL